MKPVEFKGMNGTAAKDQPEYEPLPMWRGSRYVVSCWKMSFKERIKALLTGRVWVWLLMGDKPITPHLLEVDAPEFVTGPEMDA